MIPDWHTAQKFASRDIGRYDVSGEAPLQYGPARSARRHTWCLGNMMARVWPWETLIIVTVNEATCCNHPNAHFSSYATMRLIPTSLPDFPTKLKSLSASLFLGAASDDDSCGKEPDEEDPPLGFKLTGYRLLNVAVIVGFGIFKAVSVYCGHPLTPTTVEIVGGTVLTLMYALFSFHGNHDTGSS